MYLRTVLRSIPLSLAIADTDRPCRCKSSIIIISPILITEIPLPTIRRSINDHAPPVSRSALRKTGDSAKLGKIQTALLGSIEPASTTVRAFERKRPSRKPFPDHLPRERVVIAAPRNCPCCGSGRLAKLGEDITETLEVIPRQWKVIQTVREKFTCRECEKISQPPAPFL
ncbi:IS66 family transposase zinc-finger binding domain-containing protein [Mesorhizobium sp.]|uniref:IS66 family transposase zinc-finger binding domain-containing protein n=1 Tax=Mesorhizobium sp. TaxID=1871066 RepID=UPI00341F3883